MGIWSEEGGKGRGITVCDVEGDWNRSHTGLPRGIPLYGGRLLGGEWKNHGTAVLGLLVSQPENSPINLAGWRHDLAISPDGRFIVY